MQDCKPQDMLLRVIRVAQILVHGQAESNNAPAKNNHSPYSKRLQADLPPTQKTQTRNSIVE